MTRARPRRLPLLALLLAASAATAGCAASGPREAGGDDAPPTPRGVDPLAPASLPPGATQPIAGTVNLLDLFRLHESRLTVAPDDAAPLGTADAPVEIASPRAAARTPLHRDHWVLLLVVDEARFDAVVGGQYAARLEFNGEPKGEVRLAQKDAEEVVEGVELRFDLGPELPASSVYLLAIEPAVPAEGPRVAYDLEATANGNLTWTGLGDLAGAVNPPLAVVAGTRVEIRALNADGLFHNLLLRDASGKTVAGPTRNVAAIGESDVLVWGSAAPGIYTYVCQYHPTTMKGTMDVA